MRTTKKSIYFYITIIYIFVSCSGDKKDSDKTITVSCDYISEINNKKGLNDDFTIDTAFISGETLHISMLVSDSSIEIFSDQAYLLYFLSEIDSCKKENLNTTEISLIPKYQDNNLLVLKPMAIELFEDIDVFKPKTSPVFNSIMSYFIKMKNYRILTTFFSHELGVAIYGDPTRLYRENFILYLSRYADDIQQKNPNTLSTTWLNKMEYGFTNSTMDTSIRNDALRFIAYLRTLRK